MKRRITHVTVGFPKTHAMRLLEDSSINNGFEFLALPAHYNKRRLNTIDKVFLLRSYLDTGAVLGNDIVLFTDAYDVLILDHAAVIHDRFTALGHDIIANAEANFYPDHRSDLRQAFDRSAAKWRYLNSGCYLGYTWAISIMLDYIINSIPPDEVDSHYLDQMLMQEFYTKSSNQYGVKMSLDHETSLFSPLMMSEGDFVLDKGAVKNISTGRQTCILHANGDRQNMRALEAIAALGTYYPRYLALVLIGDRTLCYAHEEQRFVIGSHEDNPALFLIDGQRAFSFAPSCAMLTYFPDFSVRNDAPMINIWETLIVTPDGIQTYHGTFVEDFVLGENPGKAKLAPVPLTMLRADTMRRCLTHFAEIAIAV